MSKLRARAGMVIWMLLGLALTLGAVLAVRLGGPHLRGLVFLTVVGAFVLILAPLLCKEIRVLEVGGPDRSLLTASTLTGRRTVDLGKLVRIQRVTLPSKGTPIDMLVVTDLDGVRLGLTSGVSRVALNRVLGQAVRDGVGRPNRPKISRRARWVLDRQQQPSSLVAAMWEVLVPLFLIMLWLVTVSVVCFPAALAKG